METLQKWKENYGDIFSFTLPGESIVVVSFELNWFDNSKMSFVVYESLLLIKMENK